MIWIWVRLRVKVSVMVSVSVNRVLGGCVKLLIRIGVSGQATYELT